MSKAIKRIMMYMGVMWCLGFAMGIVVTMGILAGRGIL